MGKQNSLVPFVLLLLLIILPCILAARKGSANRDRGRVTDSEGESSSHRSGQREKSGRRERANEENPRTERQTGRKTVGKRENSVGQRRKSEGRIDGRGKEEDKTRTQQKYRYSRGGETEHSSRKEETGGRRSSQRSRSGSSLERRRTGGRRKSHTRNSDVDSAAKTSKRHRGSQQRQARRSGSVDRRSRGRGDDEEDKRKRDERKAPSSSAAGAAGGSRRKGAINGAVIGPVVFITGTNRGIGEAVLRELHWLDGVDVIISTYRSTNQESEALARRYSSESGKVIKIIPMEMGAKDNILRGIEIMRNELQSLVSKGVLKKAMINTVIHNAGVMDSIEDNVGVHPLHVDYDVYLKHLKVNALAPSFITSEINDLLYASDQTPRVVFISSTVSSMNQFFGVRSTQTVAYPMSKTATNSYMKYMSDVKKDIVGEKDVNKDNKNLVNALLKQYVANDRWMHFIETTFERYTSSARRKGEEVNGNKLYLANPQFMAYLERYVDEIPDKDRLRRGWITVSLCPGWVETDMGNKAKSASGDAPTDVKQSALNVLEAIGKFTLADSGTFRSLYDKFPNEGGKGHLIQF